LGDKAKFCPAITIKVIEVHSSIRLFYSFSSAIAKLDLNTFRCWIINAIDLERTTGDWQVKKLMPGAGSPSWTKFRNCGRTLPSLFKHDTIKLPFIFILEATLTINPRSSDVKSNSADNVRLEIWLTQIADPLTQRLIDLDSPISVERWIGFLHSALTSPADLSAAWQSLASTKSILTAVLEKIIPFLPTDDPALLLAFVRLQHNLLALVETEQLSASSPPTTLAPEKILRATTQLTQQLIGHRDPDQLMTKAVATIADAFSFPSVNLFLVKGREKAVVLKAALWQNAWPTAAEIDTFTEEVARTDNIIRQVVETGQAAMTNAAPYTLPAPMTGLAAEMAVPLLIGGQTIGVLHVFSHIDPLLTISKLAVMQSIGQQLVLAIENLQLHLANRRRVHEQQVLLQNSMALGSSLDQDQILQLLAQKMTEALEVGGCTICRWQEADRTLVPLAEYIRLHQDNPQTTWRTLHQPLPLQDDLISQQVLRTKRPAAVSAVHLEAGSTKRRAWSTPGWQSLLALPLQAQGHPLGLVELFDRNRQRVFNPEAVQLAGALANQAAVAIERVGLLHETQNRLAEVSTFYTLSQQLISTLDLNDLLNNLVKTLRQAVGCRACAIFLLDKSSQVLEVRAADGLSEHWKKSTKLAVGQGAAGQAVAQRQTIYIPDTKQDTGFLYFDPQVRSLIVVPMVYHERVIGAINLDDTETHAFGKMQERLLTVAAAQAAIAIENATLFQQAQSEEERTRIIIQHMADGLLMLGPTGRIERVNSTLAQMLEMHPGEIIGQNVQVDHVDPRLSAICAPLTNIQQPGVYSDEVTLPGLDPRILRIFVTPIADETGQSLGEVRVFHDVTKERELDKMRDNLISTVSHELRTPLFSIRGFARLLLTHTEESLETRQEFLSIIEKQASQLTDLVTDLLDADKISAGILSIKKQPLQLVDLIHQTVLKLQGFAHQEEVSLRAKLPEVLPEIQGDSQRLEQVLTNLIGNAIKFTPAEGQVTVTAEMAPDHLLVKVIDTGVGIPADDLDRIFTKYYQVQENHYTTKPGSGLGLHLSRQLIEGHGGRIWADSAADQGSTFFIQLPLPTTKEEPA
jgi:PAS domain S-box-containing protein